jgi:hypothetical protein
MKPVMSAYFGYPRILRQPGALAALLLLGLAGPLVLARPASAAQILVNPGDDWAAKAAKARPGDEIILLPGRHRPASFERLMGTQQAPIIIRGATPQKRPLIAAQLDGIRIKLGAHVVIKDLDITGGSASGIWISGRQSSGAPERSRNILIKDVSISRIGPRGQRHGIYLAALNDVRMLNIRVEGWGGSALELVACSEVSLNGGTFRGLEDHTQNCGIRARAGCERVAITDCRFDNAGDFVLSIGGKSDAGEFVPPLSADAAASSVAEVANMTVDRCKIVGGLCPVAFIHAEQCSLRATTIVRPHRCIVAVLNESPDVRVKPSTRNTFGYNLTVWQGGDLVRLAELAEGTRADAVILEDNLWWSNETAEQRGKLGPLPGKEPTRQVFEVDPKLNDRLSPAEPAAQSFGAG